MVEFPTDVKDKMCRKLVTSSKFRKLYSRRSKEPQQECSSGNLEYRPQNMVYIMTSD